MFIFAEHPDIEMSDRDDDFMAEDEDYDLEYSEEPNSESDVDLENQYYNSKRRRRTILERSSWKFPNSFVFRKWEEGRVGLQDYEADDKD